MNQVEQKKSKIGFEFSNKMTAGVRALTYADQCNDIEQYPIYGDFSSHFFNKNIMPCIEFLAPKSLFNDYKELVQIFGAFNKSLIKQLQFEQEIQLGGGRDPLAFYRAIQNKNTKVTEINLPDFTVLKEYLIDEKCKKHQLDIPNLRLLGMDLLKESLVKNCILPNLSEETNSFDVMGLSHKDDILEYNPTDYIDTDKELLIYEFGLTVYLSDQQREFLYKNIDKLCQKINKKCIFLTTSFNKKKKKETGKAKSLHAFVYFIEKFFKTKINVTSFSPDSFFEQRGYKVIRGGDIIHNDVVLPSLDGGMSITGYVLNK